jgi:hypothetical protein
MTSNEPIAREMTMKRIAGVLISVAISSCASTPPQPPEYLSWVGISEADVIKKCAGYFNPAYWTSKTAYVASCRTGFLRPELAVFVKDGVVQQVLPNR